MGDTIASLAPRGQLDTGGSLGQGAALNRTNIMSKFVSNTQTRLGPRQESATITLHEFALVYPWLRDGDALMLTVSAADFRRAMEMALGGPEVMSTRQATDIYGWNPKRWRVWANEGRIPGAFQEENDDWRLPRESCRMLVQGLMHDGMRPLKVRRVPSELASKQPILRASSATTPTRSIRRGPRKKAA